MSSSLDDPAAAERSVCLLQSLGKASGFLDSPDTSLVAVACEASKEMLVRRAQAMVQASLASPLLSSKSCDGTPIRSTFCWCGASCHLARRSGLAASRVKNSWFRISSSEPSTLWRVGQLVACSPSLCHSLIRQHRRSWRLLGELGRASVPLVQGGALSSTIAGTVPASPPWSERSESGTSPNPCQPIPIILGRVSRSFSSSL